MTKILDSASLSGVHETPEGYLEAAVRIARTGIQVYRGSELGKPEIETVRVYRGDDAVFDKNSLAKFANLPLTIEHPKELLDSKNWKKHAVGTTGNEILRDGEYLKIGIRVTDADAVAEVKNGRREVSVGYEAAFDWTPGISPEGEAYDARQTHVAANHLAITKAARAGSLARIGDSWGAAPVTPTEQKGKTVAMKSIVLGDSAISVADEDVSKVEKFKKDLEEDKSKKAKEEADKDAELAKLRKEKVSDAQLEQMAEERAAVISDARAIFDSIDTKGKSLADIRREAVVSSKQFPVTDSTSDEYVAAAFDILKSAKSSSATIGDSVRKTLVGARPVVDSDPWTTVVDAMPSSKKEAK